MAQLIYIEKIPVGIRQQFETRVKQIASYLQIDPNLLMQVLNAESRLNPQAKNIQKGNLIAAGLLQWTKASGVPGAPASILNKNTFEQLDLVQEYFKPYRGKLKSYFDVYLVTFFPAAMGKPDSYVFQTNRYSAALIAAQNPAVNKNKDQQITMAEFKQYVFNTVPAALKKIIFPVAAGGGAALLLLLGFFF